MSFFDYVTLSLGWLINNGIWNIIATSGIFILPFVFKLVAILIKVREKGAFEGNHAPMIVSRLEDYIYISMVVIFFACYPSIILDVRVLHYEQGAYSSRVDEGKIVAQSTSCSYAEVSPSNSKLQQAHVMIGGQDVYVPLWWYFVHAISSGLTQAAVTALPCNTDLREVQSTIANLAVTDPILITEANQFYTSCFNPSVNKLRANATAIPETMLDDVTWPGSNYFLTTRGYYDTFRAQVPQKDWPYDSQRDVGLSPGEYYTGYPSCKSWWNDEDVGLKAKLIANIETQIRREENEKSRTGNANPNINKFSFWEHLATSKRERNEIVLRSVLTPRKMLGSANYMYLDYENKDAGMSQKVGSTIASTGAFFKSMSTFVEMDAVRQAAPMIQSVLLMSVIILLPIVITLGGFEPKVVVTLTFVIFAIIFLTFVWELARFLDSRLIEILYENNVVGFLNWKFSTGNKSLIDIVTSIVFIGFPILLLSALSWSGYKIGSGISNMLNDASIKMQEAGADGYERAAATGKAAVRTTVKGANKVLTKKK
ncbi:conjugal transfer protein TraG N-terminal domain-containing protein [Orbus sturtevantii]|uniref:conjugal transfer protein TraG N-terminal domain-containing protein n=1 Tax=Orbus sturtevantii TaxID=3074109 RepID=UPI00370D6031